MYFSCNVSFSSLPVFLPTILNQMGFTAIDAQGLCASLLPVVFYHHILDLGSRSHPAAGYMLVFLSCVGGIGYILLATCKSVGVRYFGVFLAAGGCSHA
jgi:hypothetical protein